MKAFSTEAPKYVFHIANMDKILGCKYYSSCNIKHGQFNMSTQIIEIISLLCFLQNRVFGAYTKLPDPHRYYFIFVALTGTNIYYTEQNIKAFIYILGDLYIFSDLQLRNFVVV